MESHKQPTAQLLEIHKQIPKEEEYSQDKEIRNIESIDSDSDIS